MKELKGCAQKLQEQNKNKSFYGWVSVLFSLFRFSPLYLLDICLN